MFVFQNLNKFALCFKVFYYAHFLAYKLMWVFFNFMIVFLQFSIKLYHVIQLYHASFRSCTLKGHRREHTYYIIHTFIIVQLIQFWLSILFKLWSLICRFYILFVIFTDFVLYVYTDDVWKMISFKCNNCGCRLLLNVM